MVAALAHRGPPLVSAAGPGIVPSNGIVTGTSVASISGNSLGAVTIDERSLKTNYNVADNRNQADEYWLRGGFEWNLNNSFTLRNQVYGYTAMREWFNAETYAYDPTTGLVDRDRFYVAHKQKLIGNKAELQWDSKLAGRDNRMVLAFDASVLNFDPLQSANFPNDSVSLVAPTSGSFGFLQIRQLHARVTNNAFALEDRLKITPTVAMIAGLRYEYLSLDRTSTTATGALQAGFPFATSWTPTTGRLGFTWETIPGLTLFSQYATAADLTSNNLLSLGPAQLPSLTTSRTYEAGLKQLLWERKAEWSLSAYDIERKNVYSDQSGHVLNLAGKQLSRGYELALAVRPTTRSTVWGNFSHTRAYYADYNFTGGSFSGNTPPNVPKIVANVGASYRFGVDQPVEIGTAIRHVGDRFNADANTVTLLGYTVADAYAHMDVRKTRLTFRVRNITDKKYALWTDPGYPDQVLLGAPRSFEVAAVMKF